MPRSKAEIVAATMLAEWRALARLTGQPSEPLLRAARETIVGMVAQDLLGEVLSGLVVEDGVDTRWVVAQRWSFAPARPPLRSCWPLSRIPASDNLRFILRVRPGPSWQELSRAARAGLAVSLPLDPDAAAMPLDPPTDLLPIRAERLPTGDHLVLESWPRPWPPLDA